MVPHSLIPYEVRPVDFVCSSKFGEDGEIKEGDMSTGVPDGFLGLDIGPKSIEMNDEALGNLGEPSLEP